MGQPLAAGLAAKLSCSQPLEGEGGPQGRVRGRTDGLNREQSASYAADVGKGGSAKRRGISASGEASAKKEIQSETPPKGPMSCQKDTFRNREKIATIHNIERAAGWRYARRQ